MSTRGLLDCEKATDSAAQKLCECLGRRIENLAIADELEPEERAVIETPLGELEEQRALDAVWRIEGAGVLAWALGLTELPDYDRQIEPMAVVEALAFHKPEQARAVLASAKMRSVDEIEEMSRHLLAVHWRLREFRLRPVQVDFRRFAREGWMGKLSLDGIRLMDDDLALGDHPITEAPAEVLNSTMSSIRERHTAINWLCGASKVYSETDTST